MTSTALASRGSKRATRRADTEHTFAPAGDPIGDAPAHFPEPVRAAWREIVEAAPDNMITRHDAAMVEVAARLLLRTREPESKIGNFSALMAALAKLGLSPSDRARIPVGASGDTDADGDAEIIRHLLG